MTPAAVQRALSALGVSIADITACRGAADPKVALTALQRRAKARYRALVHELHPDRTGGDAEKTALFDDVTQVWHDLAKMRIEGSAEPPRAPERAARAASTTGGVVIGLFRWR